MLLTTCPNCAAQFRVQTEQLNVRQGRVMCGRCRQVFDAFQSLTRIAESEEHELVSTAPDLVDTPPPLVEKVAVDTIADPIFLRAEPSPLPPDFSIRHEPPPAAAIAEITAEAAAAPAMKTSIDLLEDEPAAVAPVRPRMPSDRLLDPNYDPDRAENPLLAESSGARDEAPTRSIAWSIGAVLLGLGLLVQAAYAFRTELSQAVPESRRYLVAACEVAGCKVAWGRDEAAIRIEASDLIELPGKGARIQLTTTVANRSRLQQDLPTLELKLTDSGNQVLISRILAPQEYLGRVPAKDEGIAPGAEIYVNLQVELSAKLPASGYGVRAFYPN